jgi:putative ABC transport system permease protein
MFKLTWKGLWAHKLRFMLTGLAVVLGVAFMAGTQILTDTMGKTFDGLFESANDGVDVVVRREAAVESAFEGEARERVDTATLDRIRGIDGVDAAAGSIEGQAALVGPDGKAAAASGFGGVIGANWVEDERLNPFSIATGNAPRAPTEAVIDQNTFDNDQHTLGDTITVLGKGEPRDLTIVGTAMFGDVGGLPGITLVGVTDATAQELFAEPGAYDSVLVAAAGSVSADALSERISADLGTDRFEVLTGAADTANNKADLQEGLGFFNTFLMAFAYIALFVGMFIIYNTFSIVVAQRARDMAMLRAIGASRAQVVRSVVFESVAVGVIASAVGLGVGVLMSFGLRALLSAVGLEIPSGPIVITAATVTTAFIVGTAITVASALWPAVRSSRVKPIAALRDVAIDVSGSSVARIGAGLAVLGIGVASFAAGILGAGSALVLIGFGTVATIIGVFILGPIIALPLMHVLGAPIQRISGTTGRLARENAKRNPKRTSATASALMIGVTLVGFITILASSTKASVADTVGKSLQADYVVASGSFGTGGLSPEIEADLSALPEVAAVSPLRSSPIAVGEGSSQIAAVDTAVIGQLADMAVTSGRIEDVSGASVAVEAGEAEDDGLVVGDTVTLTFARTGPVELTVKALFDQAPPGADGVPYVVGLDTYEANVTDQFDRQVFVKAADGVSAIQSRAALDQVLLKWPNGELQDQAAFKESITSQIDTILNLIYGLLGLAIVIALIGIANTLALSVHERRRELGLLRAVGMTRPQVRSAIRWESVMIALMGTFLGFVLAVAGAWGIVTAISGDEPMSLVVPPVQLTVIVVLASVAGVLAAVGPARRAAKLDILAAIASH